MDDRGLYYLPLGGTGEIGMNLNLYAHAGRWVMVDCGVTFEKREGSLGPSRVQMADPRYIVDRSAQLDGLVITHAHMDHLGAVGDLWPRLRCPVLATPFTAHFLRERLRELRLHRKVPLRVIRMNEPFGLGPFTLELLPVTHSTVESTAVVVQAGGTTILHTGDWKLDRRPLVGKRLSEARFRALGDAGVHAVVGDSTNATRPGRTRSEADARDALAALIGEQTGRVVVTLFSSNVARLDSVCRIAASVGRHPVLLGRSLHRVVRAARRAGYLRDLPTFVGSREVGYLPPESVLLVATGSQGEPYAALSRAAAGRHPEVTVGPGDTVIFSSKIIPGNELPILRLKTQLKERGCTLFDEVSNPDIHCSGHPCQDDLRDLYRWVRPRWVIPTHGTPRHLVAHARVAESCADVGALCVVNGQLVRVGPGAPSVVGAAPVGRLERDDETGDLVEVPLDQLVAPRLPASLG